MKKYELKNGGYAPIKSGLSIGPCFGNGVIYFDEDLKSGKSVATDRSSFLSENLLDLTNGIGDEEPFDTVEIEVFKVNE